MSVLSPLSETPDLLQRLTSQQVTTMDMEMGHVAGALAQTGVQLGFGVLITDFPMDLPINHSIVLADQDPVKKYQHTGRFTHAVLTALLEERPLPDHPLESYLGRSFSTLSKENLAREMDRIGTMTHLEKALFAKLCQLTPTYSFRLTPARLEKILDDGAILSTAQVAALKQLPVRPYTPQVEETMYGAFNYIFGGIGFDTGDKKYGSIAVKIRPEVWRARSWATYASGWRALWKLKQKHPNENLTYHHTSPLLFHAARKRLGQWVVAPNDYAQSIAAWAISLIRQKDPTLLATLLAASATELPGLLAQNKLAYLEGKIKGALNLTDIEEVVVPPATSPRLINKIRSLGIVVTTQSDHHASK